MINTLSNYLRTYRKRSGLSQAELGLLLGGRDRTKVSRYERTARLPNLDTVFAYEVIFGVPARELFSGLYSEVETRIHEQAKLLAAELAEAPSTPEVRHKREAVQEIISRAGLAPQETMSQEGRARKTRVIALDPTTHGFGFVVLEGPSRLIDWGHSYVRACMNEKCLKQITELIAWYRPQVVVIEDSESKESRRGPRVGKLLDEVARAAEDSGVSVARFSPREVQKTFAPRGSITKHQIAMRVGDAFPELSHRLPPPRKIWDGEDERMSMFDAAALALTFFRSSGKI